MEISIDQQEISNSEDSSFPAYFKEDFHLTKFQLAEVL